MTLDPVTLLDPRDDLAAYSDDEWNNPTNADNDVAAIVANEIRTLIMWASVTTADPGDIDDVRAPHVWSVGRESVDPRGERYSDPDTYRESITATRKVSRGKKGNSVRVIRHGRALVGGSGAVSAATAGGRVPASLVRHAIESTRDRSSTGLADGVTLAKLATLLYDIPELIGGETTSWSEVIPAADADGRPMDPRDIAAHLDHPTGLSAGASPTLDRAVALEYRTSDDDARYFPRAWTSGETSLTWPTRYKITANQPTARRRSNEHNRETVERSSMNDRGTLWSHVTLCWSPRDTDTAFIGHSVEQRPETKAQQRARKARQTSGATIEVSHVADGLAGAAAERLAAGVSGRWQWSAADGTAGTLTISHAMRVSVNGSGYRVSGARTAAGLRATLAGQMSEA